MSYEYRQDVWIQVRPQWGNWTRPDGSRPLQGVTLGRVTAKRPRQPEGGTILVRVKLVVPGELFDPVRPEVEITLRPGDVEPVEIEVQAPEPEPSSA